jgi:hypothetical protein
MDGRETSTAAYAGSFTDEAVATGAGLSKTSRGRAVIAMEAPGARRMGTGGLPVAPRRV